MFGFDQGNFGNVQAWFEIDTLPLSLVKEAFIIFKPPVIAWAHPTHLNLT